MPDLQTPVFSTSLQTAIDHAVAAIPPEKRGAVTVGASLTGAEVAFAYRHNETLTVGVFGRKVWAGGVEAGARAAVVW